MHALPLVVALFASNLDVSAGTLIVLENSNPVVEVYTKSEVTHVAMVLYDQGEPYVYEAAPKVVRRLTYSDYCVELSHFNHGRSEKKKLRLKLYEPTRPYSASENDALVAFFDSQLGRRYSVRGIVRKKPGDGIHCAELVSSALIASGRYKIDQTYAISPAELVEHFAPYHEKPIDVSLPAYVKTGSWCQRSRNWWTGVYTWWSWACWETWTFCR